MPHLSFSNEQEKKCKIRVFLEAGMDCQSFGKIAYLANSDRMLLLLEDMG